MVAARIPHTRALSAHRFTCPLLKHLKPLCAKHRCAALQEELDRKKAEEKEESKSQEEKEQDAEEHEGEKSAETAGAGHGRKRAGGKSKQLEVCQRFLAAQRPVSHNSLSEIFSC